MDLILWRHAEAEEGIDDLARALTPKGRKQAERMAGWLHAHVEPPWLVIASPAVRTQETVAALKVPYGTEPLIRPNASASTLLDVVGWPHFDGTVIVVGHQPTLGEAASLALTGQTLGFSLKKGALVWLTSRDRDGVAPTQLKASLSPDLL